jgi:hypothetical protein
MALNMDPLIHPGGEESLPNAHTRREAGKQSKSRSKSIRKEKIKRQTALIPSIVTMIEKC